MPPQHGMFNSLDFSKVTGKFWNAQNVGFNHLVVFQPLWKIFVKMGSSSPNRGKIKDIWNHHPVMVFPVFAWQKKHCETSSRWGWNVSMKVTELDPFFRSKKHVQLWNLRVLWKYWHISIRVPEKGNANIDGYQSLMHVCYFPLPVRIWFVICMQCKFFKSEVNM